MLRDTPEPELRGKRCGRITINRPLGADRAEKVRGGFIWQWVQREEFHVRVSPVEISEALVRAAAGTSFGVSAIVTDYGELRLEAWESGPPGQPAPIELNRHGVADRDIAWKATTSAGVVSVCATWLPFADNTFERLVLADLLEYVRDEKATLREVWRVLRPGGRLTVLVPFHGPTTWLDGANWHRYLHDLTKADSSLPELAESGWRRRYRKADLEGLLTESGFALSTLEQRGTGLSELGWFIGRVLEEKSRNTMISADLDLIRIRYVARSLDRRVPLGPLGSWLIVESIKNGQHGA